jgi:hypothetical protein
MKKGSSSLPGSSAPCAAPRSYRSLPIAVAALVALVGTVWFAAPEPSLAQEPAESVHVNGGVDTQRSPTGSPEQRHAEAIAHLEETREMIAKMKAHGIGD